jgi:hypothetical protein
LIIAARGARSGDTTTESSCDFLPSTEDGTSALEGEPELMDSWDALYYLKLLVRVVAR